MTVSVRAYGPVFDGQADRLIHDATEKMRDDVADAASAEWHRYMNLSFKHPTPYYWTQVTTERQGASTVVHDRGIIYGFWLEGIGSRNAPVTRFRGYHSRDRAVTSIEPRVKAICERTLRPYLERING